jgi:hypothetical protein
VFNLLTGFIIVIFEFFKTIFIFLIDFFRLIIRDERESNSFKKILEEYSFIFATIILSGLAYFMFTINTFLPLSIFLLLIVLYPFFEKVLKMSSDEIFGTVVFNLFLIIIVYTIIGVYSASEYKTIGQYKLSKDVKISSIKFNYKGDELKFKIRKCKKGKYNIIESSIDSRFKYVKSYFLECGDNKKTLTIGEKK